ncbi:RecB-like helicase [Lebetimonas natsushimae]|nr:RecB-like helicase [Lebetimonas natsushimae]
MKKLLSVEASAGSGKTFRLANRYISLLNLDNPVNIVAITFTNKAANEMKERIVKFLFLLKKNDEELDEKERNEKNNIINMVCNELGINKKELLYKIDYLIKLFLTNDNNIQTIDSFINKILRKFSFYAGIRSNFDVGDINIDNVFNEFLKSLDTYEFNKLIEIAKKEEKFTSLLEFFENLYEKDKEIKKIMENVKWRIKNENNVMEEIEKIKNSFILATAECKQVNNFFKKNIYEMLKVKTIPSFLENGSLEKVRGFKKCYEPWMDREFEKLIEYIKIYFNFKEKIFFKNLFYFYEKYKNLKWKIKNEENIFSFKDIEHLVYYLLRENKIDKDFLYFRLDSKINHILMDEFQDTSITQWEIFEPLVDEIASGVGRSEERSFFYVGDVKQAIYRFRGGNKELFSEVANRYKPFGLEVEKLDTNFRSAKNIVNFVNEKFGLNEKAHSDKNGYVEVDEIEKENAFEKVYEKIEFLNKNGVKDKDIAVLVFTNDDILNLAEFLENKGKKVVTAKKAEVKTQPSAKAIISLMKYLHNKKLKIEKLNFLSLIGKKWNEEEFDIKIQRPVKMIKEIMDKNDLVDEASLKLLYYSSRYDTLEDFVNDIENFSEELPYKEFDGITIITIHKSKGLEFDNVIVLDRLTKEMSDRGNILFYYENARLKEIKLKIPNREIIDPEYRIIKQNEEKLVLEDKKNVEYVAFTRAKNSLIILKRNDKSIFLTDLEKIQIGEVIPSSGNKYNVILEKIKVKLRNYGKQEVKVDEEEYKPNDYEAIFLGNALHYSFECEDLEAVRNIYGDFCNIEEVKKLYKKSKNKLPNGKKEVPFIYNKKVGRIDLLVEEDDGFIIIDYKSTKPNDIRGYEKQVRHYIEVVENLTAKKAKGYLFYIDIQKKEKV